MTNFLRQYGDAATTAVGFFWKAGWAFVLGYFISGMIQTFVPKTRLTRYMGEADVRSVTLASAFGAASSSCSFAALAAARSLVLKGAHFVAAVAFMFASTNLVIELGILIVIFLGWSYLAAEVIGGLLLISISSVLIRITYPKKWLEQARAKVEGEAPAEEADFDWKQRMRSRRGWRMVGHSFVKDWQMVWEEIVIGFTVAGFMATFVPNAFWAKIFLLELTGTLPAWLLALENALVAPLVAAATFIGSMGNIPLATVLNANGVLFAGIMGFIYSDLMVPPLVAINSRYYGWRVGLYIAGIMYASIVITALILDAGFTLVGIVPESKRVVEEVTRFALDYTFWFNLLMAALAGALVFLHRRHVELESHEEDQGSGAISVKRSITYAFIALIIGGLIVSLLSI